MKRTHRLVLLAVISSALLLAGGLIALSATSHSPEQKAADAAASRPELPFTGVQQSGIVLGSPSARVTLVEFADLQCPYCAEFARVALPEIVRDYVRTGQVKIVFQGLAFLGPDSRTALRAVLAAGLQNHAWDALDELYRLQGAENSGWVTNELLGDAAAGVRGLIATRMFRQMSTPAVERGIRDAKAMATQANVHGTPTFFVGPSGGALQRVQLTSISAAALRPSLDAALTR